MNGQAQILVVDDEEPMRYFLKTTLEGEGYRVLTAASGEEALKKLEEASFDLAVVDLKMPGSIDGVQLMKEAGRIAPETAIIVLTAYASLESAIEAVRQGAFDYITKPIEIDPLCLAVEKALEKKQAEDEIRRRNEQLAFLNEVGRTITSTLNLEQILALLVEKVNEVIGVEAGSISLLDEESSELVIRFTMGGGAEKVKGLRLQIGQGIAGWVAEKGQPLLVPDVSQDPRFYPGVDRISGFVTRSILCVPLKTKNRPLGVMEVINKKGEHPFDQSDLELLDSLAAFAAVAMENAWLYQGQKEVAEELAAKNRELIEARDKLIKAERLAVIGQISASIRHEINNPLTTILGNACWLLQFTEELPEETYKMLKTIEENALRIRDILRKLEDIKDDRITGYLDGIEMIDLG